MRVTVRRWGNGAAIRIPAAVLVAAGITLDQAVEVRAEAGRIVIEPVPAEVPDLATLVAAITEDNLHESLDTGAPRGREAW